jgi:phosphatidate cytidylyltransferase
MIFLCLHEFYGLINAKQKIDIHYLHCLGGVLLFIVTYFYTSGVFPYSHIFLLYLLYIVFVFVSELYKKHQDSIIHATFILFGQCYVALPISLLNTVAFINNFYYRELLLALFIFIWINDASAYIIGTNFGKHQLSKHISPKKSWEGFVGGLIFTLLASSLFFTYYFSKTSLYQKIPLYHWIGMGIVIVVFSTWGDLIESLLKRTWKIKDSGLAIPGHGGFLDRFDSLFFAVYALLFYIKWCTVFENGHIIVLKKLFLPLF